MGQRTIFPHFIADIADSKFVSPIFVRDPFVDQFARRVRGVWTTQPRLLVFSVRVVYRMKRCSLNLLTDTHRQLGMSNGALFAVPIPEAYETVGQELQRAVEQAVAESEANGISRRGKEATPWLLNRVGQLTAGKSLASSES